MTTLLFSAIPAQVAHADPYPGPSTAQQLACDLSPTQNSANYMSWWTAVSNNGTYQSWFWNNIVPTTATDACSSDVRSTFWNFAVPDNWVSIPNIGGWPWPEGGYYTQWFWLHAVPDNWASIPNIGGWPWASGGYYTQWFWLHAVPDNWASVSNRGGWPWPEGGYYTQWFWLHAVPDNWASVSNRGGWPWPEGGYYTQWFWLHAVPDNWLGQNSSYHLGHGYYSQSSAWSGASVDSAGYYQYYFWEQAVPDQWATINNIDRWTAPSGGYYTQWFWLHAVPDDWVARASNYIGGTGNHGWYDTWFYHFATIRGFGWSTALSLPGSWTSDPGTGYYTYWYRTYGTSTDPAFSHYVQLYNEAGGYLNNAQRAATHSVEKWYAPDAHAVVIFSFDTEGNQTQSCDVAHTLLDNGVNMATFFIAGATATEIASNPTWESCLLPHFDIGNHTDTSPGTISYVTGPPQGLLDTFPSTAPGTDQSQSSEINLVQQYLNTHFYDGNPDQYPISFRAPWCDGNKSFDTSVLQTIGSMTNLKLQVDSSIATVAQYDLANNYGPQVGLYQFSLRASPYPFVVHTGSNGTKIVEFPFSYPSDYAARYLLGKSLDQSVAIWEHIFDEVYSQKGVMVILMHPQVEDPNSSGVDLAPLANLITYMKSKPGVYFSSMGDANSHYRATYGS